MNRVMKYQVELIDSPLVPDGTIKSVVVETEHLWNAKDEAVSLYGGRVYSCRGIDEWE